MTRAKNAFGRCEKAEKTLREKKNDAAAIEKSRSVVLKKP